TEYRRRWGGRCPRSEMGVGVALVPDGRSDAISRWRRAHARAFAMSSVSVAPRASRILSNSSIGLGGPCRGVVIRGVSDLFVASIKCFPHIGTEFPQRGSGAMDPRTNAPDRDRQDAGGLLVRELPEGDQHEWASLLRLKYRQRLAQDRREAGSIEGLGLDRIGCLTLPRDACQQVVLAPLLTHVMPANVERDPEEPGPRGPVAGVIGGPPLERDQERLCRDLFTGLSTDE